MNAVGSIRNDIKYVENCFNFELGPCRNDIHATKIAWNIYIFKVFMWKCDTLRARHTNVCLILTIWLFKTTTEKIEIEIISICHLWCFFLMDIKFHLFSFNIAISIAFWKNQLTLSPVNSWMSSSCFECWSSGSLSVSWRVSVPLSFSTSSIVRSDVESVTSFSSSNSNSSACSDRWRKSEPNFSKNPPSIAWILL